MSRVLVLIATIPSRKRSCERLLIELAKQSRLPDGVILVCDGYGDSPSPACPLEVVVDYHSSTPQGAGNRWRVVAGESEGVLKADDIVVCLDDDTMLVSAPGLVAALVETVEASPCAAAAMGRTADGKFAPPGAYSRGELIYGAGCGLTVRAGMLASLSAFAIEVSAAGGPDALGLYGDDDALMSAYLWKQNVRILHAATGNIFPAPGTHATSQTAVHHAKGKPFDAQKIAIARITGWPWKTMGMQKG